MSKTSSPKLTDLTATIASSFVEANYSEHFHADEHKVARLIISMIQSAQGESSPFCSVGIDALAEYLGYEEVTGVDSILEELEDVVSGLMSGTVNIWAGDGKRESFFFVSAVEVDLGNQIIQFEISPRFKSRLIDLKNGFTTYVLRNITRLNSPYSIRMYELLLPYQEMGQRVIDIQNLKGKLGWWSHGSYSVFKTLALLRSQEELAAYTDLRFELTEHKGEQGVTELTFHIYSNTPQEHLNTLFNPEMTRDE